MPPMRRSNYMNTKTKGDFSKIFHLKLTFELRINLEDDTSCVDEVEVINICDRNK